MTPVVSGVSNRLSQQRQYFIYVYGIQKMFSLQEAMHSVH